MPLLWGLAILAIAGASAQAVNQLQDWNVLDEFDIHKSVYTLPDVNVYADNPWWNLRMKDYDTAIVGLTILGLAVWGLKKN